MRWIIALVVLVLLLPTAMAAHGGMPGVADEKGFEKSVRDELPIPKNEIKNQIREERIGNERGFEHQPLTPMGEEVRKEIMEQIRSKIEIQKKNREIAKEKRENFEKSLQQRFKNYQDYRKLYQRMGLQSEEGFQYARRYVFHGAYAIVDFLNLIKADIETLDISNEIKEEVFQKIDDITQTLEEKIEKINQSNTTEEFRDAVKDLNSYWNSVRKDVKIYAELVVVAKLDDLIDRAYMIGLNLSDDPKVDLSEYFEHLEKARGFLENATANISNGEDALDDIQRAREELQSAFEILREIYRETKPFFGNETGELWVEINGTAMVNGSAIIHIKGSATVEVTPSHAVITAVGFEKSDGVFIGDGNLVIKGNVTVNATGDFWMFVKGSAYVYLEGKGEYKVKPLPEDEMGEFSISETEPTEIVIGGEQL